MSVQVGDKVKFLNDVGGGIVTRIEDKIVHVENQDGFEIPTTIHEIVVSEKAVNKEIVENADTKVVTPKINQVITKANAGQDCNIMLAVSPEIPDKAAISDLKMYLVNDSGFVLLYNVFIDTGKGYQYLKSGQIDADMKIVLKKFLQSDISKVKNLKIQILFSGTGSFQPKDPLNEEINMQSFTFYKQATYVKNNYFINDAFVYNLNSKKVEDYELDHQTIEEIKVQKEKENAKVTLKSPKPQTELVEIDLHIHEITDNFEGLSNGEMVELQMDKFRSELLNCINNNQVKKVVFIHGLGNGTLKRELRVELDRKYPKLTYQDASFKEYGFGATLVYLRN